MNILSQLNRPTPKNLSLLGQRGPIFEDVSQRTTSRIQALTTTGGAAATLRASEDLLTGRSYNTRGLISPYFKAESQPPVSNPNNRVGLPFYQVRNAAGATINPYPRTNTYIGG